MTRKINHIIAFALLGCLFAILFFLTPVWGATYYMRTDGTAANKAAATGPGSTQANCMNEATHNGETFAAGDTIVLCDDGGVFDGKIVPPTSGSSGNEITYEEESGDTVVLTYTATAAHAIDLSGRSYIIIDGFTFTNCNGWILADGSHLTIQNCVFSNDSTICRNDASCIGCDGMYAGIRMGKNDTGQNYDIEYNQVINCTFSADCYPRAHIYIWHPNNSGVESTGAFGHHLIYGNTFGDCAAYALSINPPSGYDPNYCVISNNIFANGRHTNFSNYGSDYQQNQRHLIDNNIIKDAGRDCIKTTCRNVDPLDNGCCMLHTMTDTDLDKPQYNHSQIQIGGNFHIIRRNQIFDGGWVNFNGNSSYQQPEHIYFYNNTVDGNYSNWRTSTSQNGTNIKIKNNAFTNGHNHADPFSTDDNVNGFYLYINGGTYTGLEISHNCFYNGTEWRLKGGSGTDVHEDDSNDVSQWVTDIENSYSAYCSDNQTSAPGYFNANEDDYKIPTTSNLVDQGTYLTQAYGAGNNSQSLVVDNANYFFTTGSPWNTPGIFMKNDVIYVVGDGYPCNFTATITAISYQEDGTRGTLTLDAAHSWDNDALIYHCPDNKCFNGSAPDIGYYEAEISSDLTDWLTDDSHEDYTQTQLWKDGFVDVQWFNGYNPGGGAVTVDPTGTNDSAQGIWYAIYLTHEHKVDKTVPGHIPEYSVLFSHQTNGARGIYKIGSTIGIKQRRSLSVQPGFLGGHSLIGAQNCTDSGNPRPLIQLADSATDFNTITNPKPMLWFWRETVYGANDARNQHDWDQCFDNIVRGIDFDLGSGNAGAIGIEFNGAQGMHISDSNIDATGALAAFGNFASYGTVHSNITVTGGRYIVHQRICPTTNYLYCESIPQYTKQFCFYGCTFTNQTVALFDLEDLKGYYSMLVGCHVSNTGSIPINDGTSTRATSILVLDRCLIEMGSATTLIQDDWGDSPNQGSILIRDTYTRNIQKIEDDDDAITDLTNYTHIEEYANIGYGSNYYNMSDGATQNKTIISEREEGYTYTQAEIIASLLTPVIYNQNTFPDYWHNDVYNPVEETDHGNAVDNTGASDCTDNLQDAINYCDTNNKILFLPRGHYSITDTIVLKKDSKIFGMGKNATNIIASPTWTPVEGTGETEYIIQTEEDSNGDGEAILAFLSIRHCVSATNDYNGNGPINPSHAYFTSLLWHTGRNSQVRDVLAGVYNNGSIYITNDTQHWWFKKAEVTGGGRWWNFLCRGRGMGTNARSLWAHDTSEPFYIYGWNHVTDWHRINVLLENVSNFILYDQDQEGNYCTAFRAIDSTNIKVIGHRMNNPPENGTDRAYIELEDCNNVFIGAIGINAQGITYSAIRDDYNDPATVPEISGENVDVCAFSRGTYPYITIQEDIPTQKNNFEAPECKNWWEMNDATDNMSNDDLQTDDGSPSFSNGILTLDGSSSLYKTNLSHDLTGSFTIFIENFHFDTEIVEGSYECLASEYNLAANKACWGIWIYDDTEEPDHNEDQILVALGYNGGASRTLITDTSYDLVAGQSYDLAVVHNDTSNTVHIYLYSTDGTVQYNTDPATAFVETLNYNESDLKFVIGDTDAGNTDLTGSIGDVVIINQAKSENDCQDMARGTYQSSNLTFTSLTNINSDLTSPGLMQWVAGATRKVTVNTTGGVPAIGIQFDYPAAKQYIRYASTWNETIGWEFQSGTIYRKAIPIETTAVWQNLTTPMTEGTYSSLSSGQWDYYNGYLYINVGEAPTSDHQIRLTPWPVYFELATAAGWRQDDTWSDALIDDSITLNGGTIKGDQSSDAIVASVFDGLGSYPQDTVKIGKEWDLSATGDYASLNAFITALYSVPGDEFNTNFTSNVDVDNPGTASHPIIIRGEVTGNFTIDEDYWTVDRMIHHSTILLSGTGDEHQMSVIPAGSIIRITGTNCIVTNDTIKGTLDIDSNASIRNTAIPGTVSLANGITMIANYCRFRQTQAVIEAGGGTILGGNNIFNVNDFGFTDETGGDFTLTNDSILKNTGHDYGLEYDILQIPIPQGLTFDIGAYEYSYEQHFYGDHETLYSNTSTDDLIPFELPDDYELIYEDDTNMIATTAKYNEYAIYLWKNKNENHSDTIVATWKGQTSLAGSQQPICMQIYNTSTSAWETLTCNTTVAANTNFTLESSINTNVEHYYDADDWVTFRIYQHW